MTKNLQQLKQELASLQSELDQKKQQFAGIGKGLQDLRQERVVLAEKLKDADSEYVTAVIGGPGGKREQSARENLCKVREGAIRLDERERILEQALAQGQFSSKIMSLQVLVAETRQDCWAAASDLEIQENIEALSALAEPLLRAYVATVKGDKHSMSPTFAHFVGHVLHRFAPAKDDFDLLLETMGKKYDL